MGIEALHDATTRDCVVGRYDATLQDVASTVSHPSEQPVYQPGTTVPSGTERREVFAREILEEIDKFQNCLHFVQRTACDVQVSTELAWAAPTRSFGNVEGHAVRCTSPLVSQREPFV